MMNRDDEIKLVNQWKITDQIFQKNQCNGFLTVNPTRSINRNSSVCLVSVHGVNHYGAEGKDKVADLYTGGLTLALARRLHVNAIINIYKDPQISAQNKVTLADMYIQKMLQQKKGLIVLDLHGARNNPVFDIAIGTGVESPNEKQQALISRFMEFGQQNNLKIAVNPEGYAAKKPYTITKRSLSGTQGCLQFEFSKACRTPDFNHPKALGMIRTMHSFLKHL